MLLALRDRLEQLALRAFKAPLDLEALLALRARPERLALRAFKA